MQGVHAFEAKTKVSIDLESFVAADHFLRRVDRVLDLSFVRELTASRYAVQQGRPSIDPSQEMVRCDKRLQVDARRRLGVECMHSLHDRLRQQK